MLELPELRDTLTIRQSPPLHKKSADNDHRAEDHQGEGRRIGKAAEIQAAILTGFGLTHQLYYGRKLKPWIK